MMDFLVYLSIYLAIGWAYQIVLENHYEVPRPKPRQWVAQILAWPIPPAKWAYSTGERLYRQFKNNEWD